MPSRSRFCKPQNGKLKNLILFSHSVSQVDWNRPLLFPVPVVLEHHSTARPTHFSPTQRTETSFKELQHETVLTATSAHFAYVTSEQRVGKNVLSKELEIFLLFSFLPNFYPIFLLFLHQSRGSRAVMPWCCDGCCGSPASAGSDFTKCSPAFFIRYSICQMFRPRI